MPALLTRTTTARMIALLAGVSFVAVACGDDGGGGGGGDGDDPLSGASLTVGSKEFNEQVLLGQIAIVALEEAGADVDDQTGIQGSENVRSALTSGEIDLYWEYTGTGYTVHLGHDAAEAPTDPQELYDAVKEEDAANGVAWLAAAEANNTYGIATPASVAADLGVSTLSDYAELANSNPEDASLCAAAEFLDRADGWPGLEAAYGFDLPDDQIAEMDEDVVYARLPESDPCTFGEVFETDGRIPANDLTLLEDDQAFFVKYNIALTVSQETLDEYPAIQDIFDPISALLTNEKMQELNSRVDVDEEFPEDVARDFLEEEGLI